MNEDTIKKLLTNVVSNIATLGRGKETHGYVTVCIPTCAITITSNTAMEACNCRLFSCFYYFIFCFDLTKRWLIPIAKNRHSSYCEVLYLYRIKGFVIQIRNNTCQFITLQNKNMSLLDPLHQCIVFIDIYIFLIASFEPSS